MPGVSYLAMGDSWSVGKESDANNDSLPGYPNWLYTELQKLVPGLLSHNVGVSGETSATLLTDGQMTAALAYITAEHAAGRDVGVISISIGGNDMIAVFPPPIGSGADGTAQLAQLETNLHSIYSQLQAAAPEATIVTMTYENLYPGFDFPGYGALADTWVPQLHAKIREVAADYSIPVTPVDALNEYDEALMDSLFYVTRPYEVWTLDPVKHFDFHPRPAGHQYIATQMYKHVVAGSFRRYLSWVPQWAAIAIHSSDQDTSARSTIGCAAGDGGVPALADVFAFAQANAADVREFLDGAMNRVDAQVSYAPASALGAGAGSEVERRVVLTLVSSIGLKSRLTIPGVKPTLFSQGSLNTSDPDVAALIDALTNGIGGLVPVDSHGDPLLALHMAIKEHKRSGRA